MSEKDQAAQFSEDETRPPVAANGGYEAARRPGGGRFKRHSRRWWWVYLLIFIGLVLVIVLPIIFVGVPHIAQDGVNKSVLNITSMSILNPTPDSVDLTATTVLTSHSKYHPQLDAWDGDLYLENSDAPFATIHVPAMKADNGAESHINQTLKITNQDQYTEYAKTVLNSESYTMILKGRGGLKEGSLPKTTVNYNKNIQMNGLNGLSGFKVTDFTILTTTLSNGTNAKGTVVIPNPTVMTIAMGNVTMNLAVDGTPIGTSTLSNLVLSPGENNVHMTSVTNQSAVVGIIIEPKYKSTGILPVTLLGNSSVYNGKELTYYEQALRSHNLTIQLDVGTALANAGLGAIIGKGSSSTSSSASATASATSTASP